MRWLFTVLLAVVFTAAWGQQRPAPTDTVATHLQLPGADYALFPAAARLPDYVDYYVTRTGRFAPTPQQVAEAEKALAGLNLATAYDPEVPAHMRRYYAQYPAIIKANLSKYQRQYYGFYNEHHQLCLYINVFIGRIADDPGSVPSWLRYPIQTHDGGAAFWHIYYNLSIHQFYSFSHGSEG